MSDLESTTLGEDSLSSALTSCELCGATEHTVVRSVAPYRIVRCAECGLCYLSPQPAAEETHELYSEHYFQSHDGLAMGYSAYTEQAENHRATFRDRLRFLRTESGGKRLLDVGAAAGYFVEQARLNGWAAEGIEPSRWAAAYARDQLRMPVVEGTLDSVDLPAASFDIVTLWEVIEHVPQPRRFLEQIRRVLKPGGSLFLSTPDSGSLVARVLGKRWLGWNKVPEHLFFFDRRSLVRLLADTGFDVFESRYVTLVVSWPYALERLGPSLGLAANAFAPLARMLRNRNVRINCYYDLMLGARASR